MNLFIRKPLPDYLLNLSSFEDGVTIEIAKGKDLVTLWEERTKDLRNNELIPLATDASGSPIEGQYKYPLADLDDDGIWVEAIKPSAALGDITIVLKYTVGTMELTDTVKATGIWPEVDVREEDRQNDNTARPYNRVGRNDPRMGADDVLARDKLLVWHDSGNNNAITFEVIKTDVPDGSNRPLDNTSPIWIQLEEKENLNGLNTMNDGQQPFCELVEKDLETYPHGNLSSLQINSNMDINAGEIAGCLSNPLDPSGVVTCLVDLSVDFVNYVRSSQ